MAAENMDVDEVGGDDGFDEDFGDAGWDDDAAGEWSVGTGRRLITLALAAPAQPSSPVDPPRSSRLRLAARQALCALQ